MLQQGRSLDTCGSGAATECSWSGRLRSGAVVVHAAGDAGVEHELGDSVLGSALAAARVAGIEAGACRRLCGVREGTCCQFPSPLAACKPPAWVTTRTKALSRCGGHVAASLAGGALHPGPGVDLHWRGVAAPPAGALLDSLWASAGRDPGASSADCFLPCMASVYPCMVWQPMGTSCLFRNLPWKGCAPGCAALRPAVLTSGSL